MLQSVQKQYISRFWKKNGNREEWELEHWCETADAENKQFCSGDRKEPAEGEMAALTEQYETA